MKPAKTNWYAGYVEATRPRWRQYSTGTATASKRLVRLRLDCRLQGRIDPSDVLQEAFVDASNRLVDYASNPDFPVFLWLRFLTSQRLNMLHRQHFGPTRNPVREVSLHSGALPQADSMSLAQQLLGRLTTPSQGAIRLEMQLRVQDALNTMDPIDREVLALRHFEELTNKETAAVLGLQQTAASNRYVRACAASRRSYQPFPAWAGPKARLEGKLACAGGSSNGRGRLLAL